MHNKILAHIKKMDTLSRQLLEPFLTHPPLDVWVHDVLISYFNYFLFIDETTHSEAKKDLRKRLKQLVPIGMRQSLDKMEEFIHTEFQLKGYNFLGGMTGPYYGAYLWKKTEKHTFEVELPDQHESVKVFFMYDFLMRSWMHFQTFGKQGTGGWVKRDDPRWEDGLYCVADAYDMEHLDADVYFQISLLKHEAQHFADLKVFPGISSTDLEYRAKLVEIYYFSDMKYRFIPVVHEAHPTKADPHRFAAECILRKFSMRIFDKDYVKDEALWRTVPYERIQAVAAELLNEHTHHLQKNPEKINHLIHCL